MIPKGWQGINPHTVLPEWFWAVGVGMVLMVVFG
jgi:hypothetical protein